jgi:large subunit ribosomal protein L11
LWEEHSSAKTTKEKIVSKKVKAQVRLQIEAGKANPAPPIGPALAAHGINLMAFCKDYNARTSDRMGDIIPADITIFSDGSYKFTLRTEPTSILLKKAAGIEKGAAEPNKEVAGEINTQQLREIAQTKMRDLNAVDIEGAMRQVEGTAKQMGIKVKD